MQTGHAGHGLWKIGLLSTILPRAAKRASSVNRGTRSGVLKMAAWHFVNEESDETKLERWLALEPKGKVLVELPADTRNGFQVPGRPVL